MIALKSILPVVLAATVTLPLAAQEVGYYDMSLQQGNPTQVPSITAAGGNPVNILDLSSAELSAIDVLVVQNPSVSLILTQRDLDVYMAHLGQDRLYVNQGGAVFLEDSGRIAPISSVTYSVTSADVNGDGFEDLVTGRYETGDKAYRILMNDGTGHFLDRTNRLPPSDAFDGLALEFADVDNDGDLDLYVATSSHDVLFLNDGTGFFTDASEDLQAHWDGSQEIIAADLDGDEDLDFAVAQGRVNQIYTNTLRQLSWLSLPRADRTLRLLVQGEANSSYTLVGSAIPSYQVLPAYGTLRLSYADRFIQVSGTLDGSGKAIWESPIVLPSNMAGATLYWQALIGSTPRLSNLETTEISLW